MEREGFGEEFSICYAFCFGGIRGGHVCIILHSCKRMQVFIICIYVIRKETWGKPKKTALEKEYVARRPCDGFER